MVIHQGEGSALGPSSQITARLSLQGEENSFGCPDFVYSSLSLYFCPFGYNLWVQARLHPTGNAALGSHAQQKAVLGKAKLEGSKDSFTHQHFSGITAKRVIKSVANEVLSPLGLNHSFLLTGN